jgi:hypothetical protein
METNYVALIKETQHLLRNTIMPNKLGLPVIIITNIIAQYNLSPLHDLQYHKINPKFGFFNNRYEYSRSA